MNGKRIRKHTETISETKTLLIVRNGGANKGVGWCPQCEAEVFWIERAALHLFGITDACQIDAIHRNGEEICSRSLTEAITTGENT